MELAAARESTTGSLPRQPALDGLRGIAILLVLVYHMTVMPAATPFDGLYKQIAEAGWCGVDLFFVLSGFLITRILLESKSDRHYFRSFYMRRTLRIFPLYYAVLVFSFFVLPHVPHPTAAKVTRLAGSEAWYWLYLSNYKIALQEAFRHPVLDVSWSLAIEEQFYLLWPLAVLFLSRRALMWFCGALVVATLLLRVALLAAGVSPIAIYVLTPTRVDALAVGAFLALVASTPDGLARWLPHARAVSLGLGTCLLGFAVWQGLYWDDPVVQTLGFTALAVFFGAALTTAVAPETPTVFGNLLCHPALAVLGKYSYALYLFHLPVRAAIRDVVLRPDQFPTVLGSPLPGQLLFYAMAMSATLLLAVASWNCFEKQFLKLKAHYPLERT